MWRVQFVGEGPFYGKKGLAEPSPNDGQVSVKFDDEDEWNDIDDEDVEEIEW